MIFVPTSLPGAFIVEAELQRDERGYFARTWCEQEFTAQGLNPRVAQCSVSWSERRGTLRGMHYQARPHAEAKLVRCVRGAIHDVIIDLRPGSPTFKRHAAVPLHGGGGRMLYVPEGMAHGFLTLEDATEVLYQMSTPYVPEAARGVRWDDPAFAVAWPGEVTVISDRDRTYPDFEG